MKPNYKILLLEDDLEHAELIQYELSKVQQFSFKTDWVKTLSDGQSKLQSKSYDIALVDLSYPGSSPEETLCFLQDWLNEYSMPLVILTSLNDYHLGYESIKKGFDDYISKSNMSGYMLEKTIIYAIERRKIAQELKESRNTALDAAKAKSEFLAVMSHEIRTPLNGIIGSLNLLKESEGLNPEQQDYIDTINISSDALLRIISDILDFSKIEAGKMLIEKTPFSLKRLISSIQCIFIPIAEDQKGIEFIAPLSADNINLVGDVGKIRQVLINLINNAIKFTSEGSVILHSNLFEKEGQVYLEFRVEDTGVGIAQDKVDSIFESFTQEDSSTSRKFGGTGLGLAISKKLCLMMGGDLTAESTIGEGSTFTAQIQVLKTNEEIAQSELKQNYSFSGKVLLVEDNLINKKIASKVLTKMDLDVDTADNGEIAVNKVAENEYDLIFMDLMMPVMDGIAATKCILKSNSEIPIIAMTASAFEEDKSRCLLAGMKDFVTKPINKHEIAQVLCKYL